LGDMWDCNLQDVEFSPNNAFTCPLPCAHMGQVCSVQCTPGSSGVSGNNDNRKGRVGYCHRCRSRAGTACPEGDIPASGYADGAGIGLETDGFPCRLWKLRNRARRERQQNLLEIRRENSSTCQVGAIFTRVVGTLQLMTNRLVSCGEKRL
jgi:hypothetical protein